MPWIQTVAKALPKTAEQLRTYLDSLLENLPPEEQREFWRTINSTARQICELLVKETLNAQTRAGQLHSQLQRHRKPKKNAKRDAEIMRLHGEKKTAGQIVLALTGHKLTDKIVNTVISREKRKKQAK